jgi:hypothetical protein
MPRSRSLFAVLGLAGAALAWQTLGSFGPLRGVGAEPPRKAQEWEYAVLSDSPGARGARWEVPTQVTEGKTLHELYRQLGGRDRDFRLSALLTLLGRQGWELAGQATGLDSGRTVMESWIFKRPAR